MARGPQELRRSALHFQRTREKKYGVYSGWMVNFENRDDRTARVEKEPGKVYVRIDQGQGSLSGEVITAWCRFRPVPGWPVIVGFTRLRQTEYTVLDLDTEQMPALAGISRLEYHHAMHEWGHPTGSDDVVYPRWLQLYDFGVWPDVDATGSVLVNDGVYNPSGTKAGLERTAGIDITPFQPSGSGERWVLVCLSPTGTIELWPGPIVYGRLLNLSDIPAAPEDNWWELAAVRLTYETTYVEMRPDQEDIIDLRFSRIGWPQLKVAESDFDINQVFLYSGGTVTAYTADDTGLASAVAAAISGDTIYCPPATFANDYVVPAGVTICGLSIHDTIFTGQLTLGGDAAAIETLSVVRSKGDASTYYGVIGPNSGTGYINDCRISVTQSGAGSGYGLSIQDRYGDLHVYGGRVYGSTADALTN